MDFYGLYAYMCDMHNIHDFRVGFSAETGKWRIEYVDAHLNFNTWFLDIQARELSSECSRYRVVVDHLAPWVVGAIIVS